MASSSSSGSLSPSLSYFEALRAMLFFFSSCPFSAAKSSSYEIREPIKSSRGKVFKSLASSIAVLLGLYFFGSGLMIFLTFSLFEKVFPRAPRVFNISVNIVYIEYTLSFCSI